MENTTEITRTVFLQILNARLIEDGRVIGVPVCIGNKGAKRSFPSVEEALKAVEVVRADLLERGLESWRFQIKPESTHTVDLTYMIEDKGLTL